jgi:hypothetical protein
MAPQKSPPPPLSDRLPFIALFLTATWGAIFFFHPVYPPVGTYIAVLAFIAAVVSLIPPEPHSRLAKAVWCAVFGAILWLEVSTLYHQKHEDETTSAANKKVEDDRFKDILDQEHLQFSATMDKINPILEASRRAVENTIPQAMVIMQGVSVGTKTPLPITPNHILSFNISFTNSGNDTARLLRRNAHSYLAKPDDMQQQREIWESFDSHWKDEEDFHATPVDIDPNATAGHFFSISTKPFSEQEISNIKSGNLTIYIFSRFVYSDRTGKWVSDSCTNFQDITYDLVQHPCGVKKPRRYKATWQ